MKTSKEMAIVKQKIKYMRMAEEQYHDDIQPPAGKHYEWHKKLKSTVAKEATILCKMYLLEPFKLCEGIPDAEFRSLVEKEMAAVKKALKERDYETFERVLHKAYSVNSKWILLHGGMATTPRDVRKALEEEYKENFIQKQ